MIQRYPYDPRLPLALRRMQEQQAGRRRRYPQTAAEMAAAVGYGTWSAGWLFDEDSGNAVAVFGAPELVPASAPTQGLAGPLGGADKAIRIADGAASAMNGGDVFDVGAGDDLIVAWIGKHPAAPASTRIFLSKRGTELAYWSVQVASGGGGAITGVITDSVTAIVPGSATHASHVTDTWYAGLFVVERGVGARIATDLATGTNAVLGALGAVDNVANFGPGRSGSVSAPFDCAALWIGVGVGAAAGANVDIATAVANLRKYVGFR